MPDDKLARLVLFADLVHSDAYADEFSKRQRAAMRSAADSVREGLEAMGVPLTADTLTALFAGATVQAQFETALPAPGLPSLLAQVMQTPSTAQTATPNTALTLVVGLLACDVLERVTT